MAPLDTLNAIAARRSIRSYKPEPIPAEDLRQILEAARQAPSAGNRQPWRLVLVEDPTLKAEVARAASEQDWIAEAAYIVVGVGLPSVHPRWYAVDTAIALENLVLA
ncbi:MAG: nitroreductase family protein, partial [Chloroflexota bacterium]|nr:nitroreductase family protein [Chloroflexota bacterium]